MLTSLEVAWNWGYFITSNCFYTKGQKPADVYSSDGAVENRQRKVEWTLIYSKVCSSKFLLQVFVKSSHFKLEKNRRKIVKLRTYSRSITTPILYAPVCSWTDPPPCPPPYMRTYFMDGPYHNKIDRSNGNNNVFWKIKTCTLLLLWSV